MSELDLLKKNIRKNIIEALLLLSDRKAQSEYPVPVEWFCFWFDDGYYPDNEAFKSSFTQKELEALSEFNDFFKYAATQIGDPPSTPQELWAEPIWSQVNQKAEETLKKLTAR